MKRSDALKIIDLYKHESAEVILSALEIEADESIPWEPEAVESPPVWKPKEFKHELEYQLFQYTRDLSEQLNRSVLYGLAPKGAVGASLFEQARQALKGKEPK